MEERYEFDELTILSALAMGEPGKRTFFLAIGRKGEWARVWLEKEQLQALALAINQLLFTISQEHPPSSPEAVAMPLSDDIASGLPTAELEAGEITLGYHGDKATLIFSVRVLGPRRLDKAALHCRATLAQLRQLGNQARKVCAAGRPRCALCGGPIDTTGHICPMNN
ncbi:MAG: DUF3090 family protein [Chloroflexi bacterium]|nr:DUF3090 family protein [Chloroflexota bacterium]